MNALSQLILRGGRKAHRLVGSRHELAPPNQLFYDYAEVSGQPAQTLIKERLLGDGPVMVARFGSTELGCLAKYLTVHRDASAFRKSLDYIRGDTLAFWWEEADLEAMIRGSGFFPADFLYLEDFCELMLRDLRLLDVLGSWQQAEQLVDSLHSAIKVRLADLDPFHERDPWTAALGGATVLVVHPFAESIQRQYERRSKLFKHPRVLPEFDLQTLRAVQSLGGVATGFDTWFDALDHMRAEISNAEFDIALLACGAYGLPLAAHVKRLGKKAVHMGGSLQLLFGIKGKRWDEREEYARLYNEYWVRPLPSERPETYSGAEGGSYW